MNKLLTMALVAGMTSTVSFADAIYKSGAMYKVLTGPISANKTTD